MKLKESVRRAAEKDHSLGHDTPPPSQPLAAATPGRSTASAISQESKVDYIIYTLREKETNEVVAVLIETKTMFHPRLKHTIAQVRS